MDFKLVFKTALLISGLTLPICSRAETTISCSFPEKQISIRSDNYKVRFKEGDQISYTLVRANKSATFRTSQFPVGGRSLSVVKDDDTRPSAISEIEVDGETFRLAIFYCSGNRSTNIEAKLLLTKNQAEKSKPDVEIVNGNCFGQNITEVFTNNCDAFN